MSMTGRLTGGGVSSSSGGPVNELGSVSGIVEVDAQRPNSMTWVGDGIIRITNLPANTLETNFNIYAYDAGSHTVTIEDVSGTINWAVTGRTVVNVLSDDSENLTCVVLPTV